MSIASICQVNDDCGSAGLSKPSMALDQRDKLKPPHSGSLARSTRAAFMARRSSFYGPIRPESDDDKSSAPKRKKSWVTARRLPVSKMAESISSKRCGCRANRFTARHETKELQCHISCLQNSSPRWWTRANPKSSCRPGIQSSAPIWPARSSHWRPGSPLRSTSTPASRWSARCCFRSDFPCCICWGSIS